MNILDCIINLLVGVALFLCSLKFMATGLRKAAGKGIRELFSRTKNNRFTNFGIGVAATAVIQSSDATSVMVIGFISAGVLTMFQGVCIILGAYVGTTATGLLVALSSFSFSRYLMIFAVIGIVMTFFKNELVKNLGQLLTGLGLLFFALSTMSASFGSAADPTPLLDAFASFFNKIETLVVSPLLFFLIGILFTLITQSSSATSGIVIVLVGASVINLPSGFYLVLGATIGSVMPTLLATIGGNAEVKRTGFICAIVKSLPAILAVALVWPLEKYIAGFFGSVFATNQIAVAMFLFAYSLIAMFIQLFFVERFINLSTKCVADREGDKKRKAIKYIDKGFLSTPKVAMGQVKYELNNMLQLSLKNFKQGFEEIFTQDFVNKDSIVETEDALDYINAEITSFLISLSPLVGPHDERKIGGYFHMINDIERIGDHAYNFHEMTIAMKDEKLSFSEIAHKEFNQMYEIIIRMYDVVFDIFADKKNLSELEYLHSLEDKTDKLKLKLTAAHYARLSDKTCKIELTSYYSTLVSELERVADHLVNIGYAFVNPTGDEEPKNE